MHRLLLVEDDSALVAGLKYSLEKEGYAVAVAASCGTAAALLNEPGAGFGLVILDVGLPDGTGFELCREIRKTSDVPILFLTACDEETNVVMGLDMGGDDYITKPFRLREMLSRVKALLRRGGGTEPSRIEAGDFTLYTGECRLFRGEKEIPLTPVEYRLLHSLMSNPERVLTRDQLLSRLWDSGGDYVDANTLTVYVRRLREKIEDQPSQPCFLLTVRGIGYKWSAENVPARAGV